MGGLTEGLASGRLRVLGQGIRRGGRNRLWVSSLFQGLLKDGP